MRFLLSVVALCLVLGVANTQPQRGWFGRPYHFGPHFPPFGGPPGFGGLPPPGNQATAGDDDNNEDGAQQQQPQLPPRGPPCSDKAKDICGENAYFDVRPGKCPDPENQKPGFLRPFERPGPSPCFTTKEEMDERDACAACIPHRVPQQAPENPTFVALKLTFSCETEGNSFYRIKDMMCDKAEE